MLFLDLNIRKKVHQMDYNTENLVISCGNILSKSYSEYTRMFGKLIDTVELKENLLVEIELDTNDVLDEADMIQFHQCLVGLFTAKILTEDRRNTEDRLSVDRDLAKINAVVLRKLINYKTKINCFNLVLKCGKQIMDTTGGYYVCA